MSHETLNYFDILRSSGHRVTQQRLVILDAICEAKGHTTLGQIFARVKAVDSALDRSTLYRTLDLFQKVGLVVSAEVATGEKVYEISDPNAHHHLECKKCGKVELVDHRLVQPMFDILEHSHNFTIKMNHLMIFGICLTCRQDEDPG
jgi:Fe2+ or Zn2+ uptake regulation protein